MTEASGRRALGVDATSLSIGAAVSGLAAYAYAALGARSLGADAFAPVSVLWTCWAVTGAALAFPLQHWVIRRAHADGRGGIRRALPRLTLIVVAVSVATGVAGWVARADLFRRDDLVFPVLLGTIPLGSALMGLVRGGLASRGRFGATAVAFAGENLIRLGLAAVGAAAGWSAGAFGLVLIAGFAIGVWPGALRFEGGGPSEAHDRQLGFFLGIAAGSLLAQTVLTGAPVALAIIGAPGATVTSVFAALALLRAPYVLATGLASRITGTLTTMVMRGEHARLRTAHLVTIGATAALAAAGAGGSALVGGPVLRALFGPEIELSRGTLAILGAGAGVAVGTLVEGLVLISRARWRGLVVSWCAALAGGVAWMAAVPGGDTMRAASAFAIAEGIAFVAMLGLEGRALRSPARQDVLAALGG